MLRIPLPEDDGFALRLLKRCAHRGGRHTASGGGCALIHHSLFIIGAASVFTKKLM